MTTNWGILDNVLSSGNAYSGTVTNPDPLIVEQDQGKYSFPLVNTFLDLPVIEASPYIPVCGKYQPQHHGSAAV